MAILLDAAYARDCSALRDIYRESKRPDVWCNGVEWPALYDMAVSANVELDTGSYFIVDDDDADTAAMGFSCPQTMPGDCSMRTSLIASRWYLDHLYYQPPVDE